MQIDKKAVQNKINNIKLDSLLIEYYIEQLEAKVKKAKSKEDKAKLKLAIDEKKRDLENHQKIAEYIEKRCE